MLNKDKAERLAAEVLETERSKRPVRPRRKVWFMSLWRWLCPDLNRLAPDVAADVAREAMGEANRNISLRVLIVVMVAINYFINDRRHVPVAFVLAAILLILAVTIWLVRRGVMRRLPEALARSVEVGEV